MASSIETRDRFEAGATRSAQAAAARDIADAEAFARYIADSYLAEAKLKGYM
jgi:hypothetical protein